MSQHDYIISNDTAANVRSDLNNALAAVVSQNSGGTEPSTTYANMVWVDTGNDLIKVRNEANSAWITLGELDQSNGIFKAKVNVGSDSTGDIYYRDSSGTFQRLAVGTEGQVLKVASGLPSWGASAAAAQTAAPTLGTPYRASTLASEITIAVSNLSSYVFPTLTYYITDNADNVVSSQLEATATPIVVTPNLLTGTGPHTVHVTAKEFGKTVSSTSTASIPVNTGSFSYRYYRLSNMFASQMLHEWRLYTDHAQQGTDVSVSAIAASYNGYTTNTFDKVHDGDTSTRWWLLSASGAQWIRFDLGASPPTIKSMSILSNTATYNIVDAVLEASNTGAFAGEEVTLLSDIDTPTVTPYTLYLG